MMQFRVALLFVGGLVLAACGDDLPPEPEPARVRTVLVHQNGSGENILLSTDGLLVSPAQFPDGLLPIGTAPFEQAVAALTAGGDALVLGSLTNPERMDTIIRPMPTSHSLVAFSNDGRYVALVSYAPDRVVLVYDRANGTVDSLAYGTADPALPPILSPDNERIALITVTDLSAFVTVLFRSSRTRTETVRLGFSRILNRPIFGWPRWTDDGILLGMLRSAFGTGPDTIIAGLTDPDRPDEFLVERLRAVMAPVSDARPALQLGLSSTYAFSSDGMAIVLGAEPGTGTGRHAIYLVTDGVPRVQLLFDQPEIFPVFPLFVD